MFKDSKLDLEGQCRETARLGAHGIDLVGPEAFPLLKKYALIPTMVPGGSGIKEGINDKKNHSRIDQKMREAIKAAGKTPAAGEAQNVLNPADNYGGLMSFRYVAPLSLILIVVFGIIYMQDRRRGGYRPEKITG